MEQGRNFELRCTKEQTVQLKFALFHGTRPKLAVIQTKNSTARGFMIKTKSSSIFGIWVPAKLTSTSAKLRPCIHLHMSTMRRAMGLSFMWKVRWEVSVGQYPPYTHSLHDGFRQFVSLTKQTNKQTKVGLPGKTTFLLLMSWRRHLKMMINTNDALEQGVNKQRLRVLLSWTYSFLCSFP